MEFALKQPEIMPNTLAFFPVFHVWDTDDPTLLGN
jgi:hypothetical protein